MLANPEKRSYQPNRGYGIGNITGRKFISKVYLTNLYFYGRIPFLFQPGGPVSQIKNTKKGELLFPRYISFSGNPVYFDDKSCMASSNVSTGRSQTLLTQTYNRSFPATYRFFNNGRSPGPVHPAYITSGK